jgi:hypothetical protein
MTLLIPLIPTRRETSKYDSVGFYVNTNPDDADSDKIKKYVIPYEDGDVEELLEFVNSFRELIRLKAMEDNGPVMFQHLRLLLNGDTLTEFNDAHEESQEDVDDGDDVETVAIFNDSFERWLTHELPDGLTGRNLRDQLTPGKVHKPAGMNISKFVKRIKKINKYITYCPGDAEIRSNDDLIAVLEQAVPHAWRVDLKKRADHASMTLSQVAAYYTLLEGLEPAPRNAPIRRAVVQTNNRRTSRNNRDRGNRRNDGNNGGGGNGGNAPARRNPPPRNRGNAANNNGAPALRRSNRRRGPYCPHHRTNEHDGSSCPDYQEYLTTRNNGREVNAIEAVEEKAEDKPSSDEEVYVMYMDERDDSSFEDVEDRVEYDHDETEVKQEDLSDDEGNDGFIDPYAFSQGNTGPSMQQAEEESEESETDSDDSDFEPSDGRDWNTAPQMPRPLPREPRFTYSDYLDGQHALAAIRREHDELRSQYSHQYYEYLTRMAEWYHQGQAEEAELDAALVQDELPGVELRYVLEQVAMKKPVTNNRTDWIDAVLGKLMAVGITTPRALAENIVRLNRSLHSNGHQQMHTRTLSLMVQCAVSYLLNDLSELPEDVNEAESFSILEEPTFKDDPVPTCEVQLQLAKTAYEYSRDVPYKRPTLRALVDSGASNSIFHYTALPKGARMTKDEPKQFSTQGGKFITTGSVTLPFILPEFTVHKKIALKFHVDSSTAKRKYDVILGRDFLCQQGIVLDFKKQEIAWDELSLNMHTKARTLAAPQYEQYDASNDFVEVMAETYVGPTFNPATGSPEEAKIRRKIAELEIPELTSLQKLALSNLLYENVGLFKEGPGRLPGPPLAVETIQPTLRPFHRKAYRIPHSKIAKAKAEVEEYVRLGIWTPNFDSPWGSPTMFLDKPNGDLRLVTDFREVNKLLIRKPYPMPKIDELFQNIDGYDYATILDLQKGFYHVVLNEEAKRIFTTVLPWGKYSYNRMPMGYAGAPDVFQHRMDQILGDLPFCACFIDDIGIWTKGSFKDHLKHLETVLERLGKADLRVNLNKSEFVAEKMTYLGFQFTKQGIRADPKKIVAVQALAAPTTKKQLRGFLGMTNYLRQHIPRYSHHSAPLTDLLKGDKKTKFIWNAVSQQGFEKIRELLARSVMLSFPDYGRKFFLFTDASKYQIGAVVIQKNDDGTWRTPIAFFSKKMNPAQQKYTVMEQELLSIVESLKCFRTMLLGHLIVVYTDHKNLTFEKFASDRVARWRLYVEEYGPELRYVPGENNIIADAFSRLPMMDRPNVTESEVPATLPELAEVYDMQTEDKCPIDARLIADKQREEIPKGTYNRSKSIRVGDVILKVNKNDRIMIPESLRQPLLQFYHDMLRHPGIVRMTNSLWVNFAWPSLKEDVTEFVKYCEHCQKFKKARKHYGHLNKADERTLVPWHTAAVDLTGPWTIRDKHGKEHKLLCLTVIDLATRWIEIVRVHEKTAENVALLFDRVWLSRYPRPMDVIHDAGTEFSSEFSALLSSYGINAVPTTVKNPRANAILERVHGVMGDMLRTYNFAEEHVIQQRGRDQQDPFDGFIAAVSFAIRATYQTAIGTSPASLVFRRDMFFPTKYVANWKLMKERRNEQMMRGVQRENKKRIAHHYRVGELVLIRHDMDGQVYPKQQRPTSGPFRITAIRGSTLEIDCGRYEMKINMRRVQPYYTRA